MSRAITVTPPTGTSAAPRPSPPAGLVAARSVLHVTGSPRGEAATAVRSAVERAREAGVDVQWATVSSEGWFAPIVERLTSALQGSCAGETELGEPERLTYTSVLNAGAGMLAEMLPHPGIVFLHDPATAGLCRSMKRAGATVAWVCHLPLGEPNGTARGAWEFLFPHLEAADRLAFLRPARLPPELERRRIIVPPPSPLAALATEDRAPQGLDMTMVLAHLSAARSPS